MRRVFLRNILVLLAALALGAGVQAIAGACGANQQSCSGSYGIDQAFFGNGGSLDTTCSSTYCAKESAGELGVGNPSSTNYQTRAGFNVNREPSLTLIVNDSNCLDYLAGGLNINLGYLSTGSTTHANVNFSVKTYLASGYIVQTVGAAPTSSGPSPHTFSTPTGAASAGTEKFGINLVANTGFGNNVQQLPDSTFSFGGPAAGYNTTNSYKYTNGDTIASAAKSSGTSCYDMSYVFDIGVGTQAGTYTMNQAVVATSTY